MKKVASVVLLNSSVSIDKPFSYCIPDEYINEISAGTRVVVPFGSGNRKTEGIVVSVSNENTDDDLKSILHPAFGSVSCTEDSIKLCLWLRNKYFCTYSEALKTAFPPGFGLKITEYVSLGQNTDYKGLSALQSSIINALKDKYQLSYEELCDALCKKSLRQTLKKMAEKQLIEISHIEKNNIKAKTIKIASLCIPRDDAKLFLEQALIKAPVQAKITDILLQNEFVAIKDIVMFSGGNYSAVTALKNKGIIKISDLEIKRNYENFDSYEVEQKVLTAEQQNVYNRISDGIDSGHHNTYLLHGVTGSGKTEVYLQLISKVINSGKSTIVLVPEISLTPQMVGIFKKRFKENVAVFHSGLSLGERLDEWNKIKNGEVKIAVGARSAIFAPFNNLGLIIVDEEHESTYKSEMSPKYNAIEVAKKRAEDSCAPLLLASATPSVVSYYKALNGEYKLLEMKKRYNNTPLPEIIVADMRSELKNGNKTMFSGILMSEIVNSIKNNKQTILFLNRRGYSTFVSCRNCGYVALCPNCSVSLTYHTKSGNLKCHTCGFATQNLSVCPSCSSTHIKYFGAGTQKIEAELDELFDNPSYIRMDMDTTASKFSHERILEKFKNDNINILIGTQMVTKGLDFENVNLVGVLAADTTLNLGSYKSAEKAFSQIIQVCGRAGRRSEAGKAIVQTYQPEHYSIQFAKNHDYKGFYENEILFRKTLNYPPFCDIISIVLSGDNEEKVKSRANDCYKYLRIMQNRNPDMDFMLIKPHAAPIYRIKQKFRMRIIIKTVDNLKFHNMILKFISAYHAQKNNQDVYLSVDVNPENMF